MEPPQHFIQDTSLSYTLGTTAANEPSYKRVLCLIDSLGSGGAQRQMVNLACGLKSKGHDVEMLVYHPEPTFFRHVVADSCIPIHEVHGVSGFSFTIVRSISHLLNTKRYDCLISFLVAPNIYCILSALLAFSSVKLVVGERTSTHFRESWLRSLFTKLLYLRANHIVANSFSFAKSLDCYFWLTRKVSVIYNGYKLSSIGKTLTATSANSFSMLVIGRISYVKNGVRLLKALLLFYQRNQFMPKVSWVGRGAPDPSSVAMRTQMDNLISANTILQDSWQWLGERQNIPQLLEHTDALIHVSLFEGLPNVVCEAFLAAKPVILSAVCDHPYLVEEGVRGHLCDPLSSESICSAIERFHSLSPADRHLMGIRARTYAEIHLSLERMVSAYEALLN